MNDGPWRCFVAVPLPDELRARLAVAVAGWRSHPGLAGVRWAEPAGWHVTIAFLGATDPERVRELEAAMAATSRAHQPWSASTGGIGAFPSPSRARVAWYGVADPDGRFERLAVDMRSSLAIADGGPFRSHVTLARVTTARRDVRTWIASASAPVGVLSVDRIELVRSHIGRGPARYETLAATTLGVPSRA